ncbi:flagellar biosynthetic protein FliO [Paenibacillus pasadenensis]|uniref:Flagellar biosynthesis protein FliZ n=1 Tax=Paenibacillus pasadenensis TaxID=217090 RepID=A0A2N5N775_9BACL|nr:MULTISPECIES: flagellar biosynthetic protein FliO [Paenibacillus]PLT46188.1 Flagellar biosynthesis protein FliZ [Paenibacillus pasadenensis]QGG56649.1 flagellar protein [Paenibacillus sp. B01]
MSVGIIAFLQTAPAAAGAASASPDPGSLLFPSPAAELDGAPQFTAGSMTGSLIWMIVALALVIGLIMLLIRFLSRRNQLWNGARTLQSLGGLTLAPNKSMQLVEAGGKIYVLGVGDDVAVLDVIADPEQVAELKGKLVEQGMGKSPIGDWLKAVQERKAVRKDGQMPDRADEAKRFERMLQQKLEQQSKKQEQMERLLQETTDRERLREE